MRGKISDLDLTDYALNELQPGDRLYVESMLAVSEECRNDVYEMIEVAQMLEEGFELEDGKITPFLLKPEQREHLLSMPVQGRWFAKTAVALAAAACAAFAVTHPGLWEVKGPAAQVAQKVSSEVSNYVAEAVAPKDVADDFVAQLGTFRQLAEDPALKKWFSADWLTTEIATTPAPWNQPAAAWDPMPRVQLDMPMP